MSALPLHRRDTCVACPDPAGCMAEAACATAAEPDDDALALAALGVQLDPTDPEDS